jgi:hypothetical protein
MKNRLRTIFILGVSSLVITACLHTQDEPYRNPPKGIVVTMISGNDIVDVKGLIKENVYFNKQTNENQREPYEDLIVKEEIITIEQVIELFEGQEYQYSLQGSEIISFYFQRHTYS